MLRSKSSKRSGSTSVTYDDTEDALLAGPRSDEAEGRADVEEGKEPVVLQNLDPEPAAAVSLADMADLDEGYTNDIFLSHLQRNAQNTVIAMNLFLRDAAPNIRTFIDLEVNMNKKGGLTTILEKSLGAASKGGTSPLTGVYRYAEPVTTRGFTFMDSPGYDPASVTGQIASGCNLVTFTTGRGSAFGSKPSPCIKIATNTEMYEQLVSDMDIDAGAMLTEGQSLEEKGREIYQMLLDVASGTPSKSEAQGLGDYEFVPWQIGATM